MFITFRTISNKMVNLSLAVLWIEILTPFVVLIMSMVLYYFCRECTIDLLLGLTPSSFFSRQTVIWYDDISKEGATKRKTAEGGTEKKSTMGN